MNTNILAFVQETLQRLFNKSPKFFKVWNLINAVVAVVAGIPALLIQLDIILPPDKHWVAVLIKLSATAGTWGYLMGKLSVERPVVTQEGLVVEPKKEIALAYTDKVETKQLMKQDVIREAVPAVSS